MLADFQQALADLIASPALCIESRRNPDLLREKYHLTELEAKRLDGVINHPAMACNCMLYRANRLAPLALNLPNLMKSLGPDLRGVLDDFWLEYRNTDVHFYVESYRFCEFVREELARGRELPEGVLLALDLDTATLTERLEMSHTELYSPYATRK
jgi:hypothetical protein